MRKSDRRRDTPPDRGMWRRAWWDTLRVWDHRGTRLLLFVLSLTAAVLVAEWEVTQNHKSLLLALYVVASLLVGPGITGVAIVVSKPSEPRFDSATRPGNSQREGFQPSAEPKPARCSSGCA